MSVILRNVSYTYGKGSSEEKLALRDINLEIRQNEFVAVVGHTGSGKSTLIQLLNGLEKAESGEIFFHGKNIYDKDFSMKMLRSKVGLVFQYPEHQLFESTVVKDVAFGPSNMGWEQLKVELSTFGALKDVGIGEELFDVSPLALSGGQKRRVAIAGVLAMEPEILVLDEPMAGLDPAGRKEIFELLKKLYRERKITVLLVSHSMEDVAEYAGRVIVMNQGQIVLDGEPRKVFRYEKELRKIGLGVPQATSLMHFLAEQGAAVQDDCLTVQESITAILKWLT
ncbi:MAG: energy-coupling factor transporter ATPase [Lachnospiraceae bacterium]|mgnify:FL=1|jgi:ABC-type cobalt transport system, ATPase component|nr:energy-coupling factor transporter ATPase [Lachnospiraceae bacterium]